MIAPKTFSRYHFQGQHENERVLKIIHRHWFNILMHLFVILFLSIALVGSLALFSVSFPDALGDQGARFIAFLENTLLIFLWLYGFLVWIDYFFDVWIITDERIVNIEQKGLFTRSISELQFSRVQDVTSSVNGFISTMLNFGDVYVQTAAEEKRFVFRQVADPFAIKDEIMSLSRGALSDDVKTVAHAFREKTPETTSDTL